MRERSAGRRPRLETALLLVLAGALLLLGRPAVHQRVLQAVYPSPAWPKRAAVFELVFTVYGAVFLGLAVASALASAKGRSLASRFARAARKPPPPRGEGSRRQVLWLSLALLVGAAAGARFLSQPMRFDESLAYLNFSHAPGYRVFNYSLTTNHVFHSILAKASTSVLGSHPAAIRIPAYLGALASLAMLFLLCRELLGPEAGLFAAGAAAAFPYLVLWATNARGYSLVILFTLCLGFLGARFAKEPSPRGAAALSAFAALALWTMPTALYAVAGVACWIACLLLLEGEGVAPIVTRFLLPFGAMTAFFTFALYTPVILVTNGVEPIVAHPAVRAETWPDFLRGLSPLLSDTLADVGRDVPAPAAAALCALLAAGLAASVVRRNWRLALLLPAALAGCAVIFAAHPALPFPRTWSYFIPFLLMVAAAGWVELVSRLPPAVRRWSPAAVLLAATALAASLASRNAVALYPDTGAFAEADRVAAFLRPMLKEKDRVRAFIPADWPTDFYLWRLGADFAALRSEGEGATEYFVVKKSVHAIRDLTNRRVERIFDFADAAVYRATR